MALKTANKRGSVGNAKSLASKDSSLILAFATLADWVAWLKTHHATSMGLWVKFAKKKSKKSTITYFEALDGALMWGWIDSQKKAHDDEAWLQRFTPRTAKSPWSKINREKANALIKAGKMEAAGLAEVERAKKDGRWAAAYDSAKSSVVPEDLAGALAANKKAAAFFEALDGANRYAILYRVQTAKKAETRASRIALFVEMCAKGEKIHAPRKARPAAR